MIKSSAFIPAIISVFSFTSINAQIVYTNVKPDTTTSGTYNLDLNNDGTIDFVIAHTSKSVSGKGKCKGQTATNDYIKVTPLNNNQVLDTGKNVRRMLPNETIDANVTSWGSNTDQLMSSREFSCIYQCYWGSCGYYFWPTNTGEWYPSNDDGFLGLRIISGGHSYFGWVQINIVVGVFTIKGYAFNSKPDRAILTGQSRQAQTGQLIGYWPFDDNGSDQSGNNRDLVLFGSPNFGTGIFGQALSLDGTGNMYARRPVDDTSFKLSAHDFTVSIWVKYNSSLDQQVLIEKFANQAGPGWTLTKLETQSLQFYAEPLISMTSDPVNITDGIWHNVIVTRLSNDFKMYFDGILIAEGWALGHIHGTNDPLLVGRRDSADGRIFGMNGLLDDAAIWSRALSGTEVSQIWNNGNGTPANQLGSGATGVAKSQNSNKSKITGLTRLKLNIVPNPVVSSTTISFSLDKTENVSIQIFDVNGGLIQPTVETQFIAGTHQLKWDAANLKAGNYVLKMKAGNYVETRKLVVAK